MHLIKLFISFLKIGAFSFGGGYAMLPLISEELIKKHSWLSVDKFIDVIAISQITPGPIAVNSATFLGYEVGGILGAIISTIAVVTPSVIIVGLIAYSLDKIKDKSSGEYILKYLRPVVIGLIASAGVLVAEKAFIDIRSIIIAVVIFILVVSDKISPILAIGVAAIMGIVIF